jgi:hypothetical protein
MIVNGYKIERDADLRDADLRDVNLRDANLSGADLSGANLSDAYLWGADLRDANLRGANLSDANLYDANLYGADLSGADLSDAYLIGVDLRRAKGILSFTLGQHFGFSYQHDGVIYVQIGCECHTLEHWLTNYEQIGIKNGYSNKEINRYKRFMKAIRKSDFFVS